jgi:dihydrofolate reductase
MAGPGGTPLSLPVFVVTHEGRAAVTKGKTTFNFVTEGIESALKQAKAAAGDRDVVLQGANIVQQYLVAGVVDEIMIHLVPVLLGTGIRLFEHLGVKPIELENIDVIDTPGVTHLGDFCISPRNGTLSLG